MSELIMNNENPTILVENLSIKMIDNDKCTAVVNIGVKNTNKNPRQCHNRHLKNSHLCGVHVKAKKVITADVFWASNQAYEKPSPDDFKIEKCLKKSDLKSERIIPQKPKLKIIDNQEAPALPTPDVIKKWRIKEIREHILSKKIKIDLKQIKEKLCQQLISYYGVLDNYTPYIPQIKVIQSVIKGAIARRRHRCLNKEDVYTFESIYDVPSRYFFRFKDEEDGRYYGFDIRSFHKMIDALPFGKLPSNPYNLKELSSNVMKQYHARLAVLLNSEIGLELIDDLEYEVTPEKEMVHYMVKIFHKFDMLDNYTDYRWFKNLTMFQLKKLYKECEDIWNYRANLSNASKIALVKEGKAFSYPVHKILHLSENEKNLLWIQKFILSEFERFADEGASEGDKKTGAKLMLAALTCVSTDAANAYPYLVWSMAPNGDDY